MYQPRLPHFTTLLTGTATLLLSGCASAPSSASRDVLDAHTGTTLTRLAKPVELLSAEVRGATADPFAYLGPFQTNRMGSYALYLWVAVPAPEKSQAHTPEIQCDGQTLTLKTFEGSLSDLGLSDPPYPVPAPWSRITYFVLGDKDLDCLRHASQAVLSMETDETPIEHFMADRDGLAGLATFGADAGANASQR